MLVRSASLPESMSRYLIDRIEATANIRFRHTHTEIIALYGSPEGQLERVRWRNNTTGEETEKQMRNLFLFIGVDPATCCAVVAARSPQRKTSDKELRRSGCGPKSMNS